MRSAGAATFSPYSCRRFRLDAVPADLPFHLFADSLYRLRVNGKIIGFGPARFLPPFPEYDSYDLAPFLQLGDNTVLVEVNSRGAPCFQAVVSRGGFIAAGAAVLPDGSILDLGHAGRLACGEPVRLGTFRREFQLRHRSHRSSRRPPPARRVPRVPGTRGGDGRLARSHGGFFAGTLGHARRRARFRCRRSKS